MMNVLMGMGGLIAIGMLIPTIFLLIAFWPFNKDDR
jgi:hypothetical protein